MPYFLKTKGIVLSNLPYSESSCIVKIFTPDKGVISCLIRGIRKNNSKNKAAFYKELSLLCLELNKSDLSDFYYVTDVKFYYVYKSYMNLHGNIVKNCMFMFICELLNKCLKDESHPEHIFNMLIDALKCLDENDALSPDFHIIFMTKLIKYLGFAFNMDNLSKNSILDIPAGTLTMLMPSHELYIPAEFVMIINQANEVKFNSRLVLCKTREQRIKTVDYILQFYKFHFPDFKDMKSIAVLHEILE